MSDEIEIVVKINGKVVPVSNISLETFNKIRDAESAESLAKQEENAPVFSVANGDVLIIKLTDSCKEVLKCAMDNDCPYISLDRDSCWDWGFDEGKTFVNVKEHFQNVVPLFGNN